MGNLHLVERYGGQGICPRVPIEFGEILSDLNSLRQVIV